MTPLRVTHSAAGRSDLPTGGPFTHGDQIVVQSPPGAAGVAIDDARLYERARRRERWLRATAEVTTELLSGTDPDALLQLIAGRAGELTGADWTLIAVPADPETAGEIGELTVAVSVGDGARADLIRGRRIPVSGSTTGAVFTDHVPRNVTGLAHDVAAGLGMAFGPALAVPMGADDALSGVLLAVRTAGSPAFGEDDLELASTLADQAALTVQRAESRTAQHERQVLADRDRITRDLHEHVIGRLSGIGLTLHDTQHLAKSPAVAARIADHIEHLNQVITEVRTTVFDRHTEPADIPRLGGLLHDIVGEITTDTDLRTSIGITGRIDIVPADLAVHAQAVLREAVTNTARHAHATELTVTVTVGADLVIDVTDNGVGIPVTAARGGLHHLAARAAATGGSSNLDRPGGGGTRPVWAAPLQ